jgi:hypothetical protein
VLERGAGRRTTCARVGMRSDFATVSMMSSEFATVTTVL